MLFKNKPGNIVDLTVYESFAGKVKVLQRTRKKMYVEIVDVHMCYPCEVGLSAGEKLWISKENICHPQSKLRENVGVLFCRIERFFRNPFCKKEDVWKDDLPF